MNFYSFFKVPFLFCIVGFLVGIISVEFMPKSWEAVGIIRSATINERPYIPENFTPSDIELVETIPELQARLRAPSTSYLICKNIDSTNNNCPSNVLKNTRLTTVGNGLEIRVRSSSSELSLKIMDDYLNIVSDQQAALLKSENRLSSLVLPARYTLRPSSSSEPVSPNRLVLVALFTMISFAIGVGFNMISMDKK